MKSTPSLVPQIVGEWIGKYHGHFEEVIRIDLQDGKWIATKITGDENVPAGEITWRVDPTTCIGEGQIAGQGFLKPSASSAPSAVLLNQSQNNAPFPHTERHHGVP